MSAAERRARPTVREEAGLGPRSAQAGDGAPGESPGGSASESPSEEPGPSASRGLGGRSSSRPSGPGGPGGPSGGLIALVRSRNSVAALTGGAVLVGLANALGGLGFATLSPPSLLSGIPGLLRAGAWLTFVGFAVALGGVVVAAWPAFLAQRWSDAGELGAAVIATLVIAIGYLVSAPSDSLSGGSVVIAVGFGLWALLLGYRAGLISMAQSRSGGSGGGPSGPGASQRGARPSVEAQLWLASGLGVLALAIGEGLSGSQATSSTPLVVGGVFSAAGFAALVICLAVAVQRRALVVPGYPTIAAALWALSLAELAMAVVAGVVLGPNETLSGLRVGEAVPAFGLAVGVGLLGLAAGQRAQALDQRSLRAPL